jgi:ABC-type antimicrobial peptide transport system permease subunit
MKSLNDFRDWIIAGLICMAAGCVGAILPSKRAAETNIVDALKKGVR